MIRIGKKGKKREQRKKEIEGEREKETVKKNLSVWVREIKRERNTESETAI